MRLPVAIPPSARAAAAGSAPASTSSRARRANQPGAGAGTGGAGRRLRLLVVDDSVDTARGVTRLLQRLGHEVTAVHDGRAAVEAARGIVPDCVLLDIGLPVLDGYQVARALRDDERLRDTVIIAVSGYGQAEDRRRSRAAGFNHHLIKPVSLDTLVSLLSLCG
ncbi:MAG: response regulator [Isosphaeraceae bacterium]